ncbi:unnamed protein product [Sphenostylis stenocarpa]|uniref:Uncharacterized protein n=1 Tax=Sphenostylis stenocarpa TaxID=92480 RepID=A0AA86S534_9FABA|nr:unnamed protein product [Sphenostylis stenocarpa]
MRYGERMCSRTPALPLSFSTQPSVHCVVAIQCHRAFVALIAGGQTPVWDREVRGTPDLYSNELSNISNREKGGLNNDKSEEPFVGGLLE